MCNTVEIVRTVNVSPLSESIRTINTHLLQKYFVLWIVGRGTVNFLTIQGLLVLVCAFRIVVWNNIYFVTSLFSSSCITTAHRIVKLKKNSKQKRCHGGDFR